jgi:hypothetical protein
LTPFCEYYEHGIHLTVFLLHSRIQTVKAKYAWIWSSRGGEFEDGSLMRSSTRRCKPEGSHLQSMLGSNLLRSCIVSLILFRPLYRLSRRLSLIYIYMQLSFLLLNLFFQGIHFAVTEKFLVERHWLDSEKWQLGIGISH